MSRRFFNYYEDDFLNPDSISYVTVNTTIHHEKEVMKQYRACFVTNRGYFLYSAWYQDRNEVVRLVNRFVDFRSE